MGTSGGIVILAAPFPMRLGDSLVRVVEGLNKMSGELSLGIVPGWNLRAANAGPQKRGLSRKGFVHASPT